MGIIMGTTTSLMTFEDFERLPEEPGKRELLKGELIELPPAKKKHNEIAECLYLAFKAAEKQRRGGKVHHQMGYRVTRSPDSWLQPDVSLTHPGQAGEDYYEGAPLLAVEVVSESNTAEQMDGKVKVYLANGAREVWVVYPKTSSVWIYREGAAVCVQDTLQTELLPSLSIPLGSIFPA
jgi:Uma2 family endonuclease